MSQSTAEHGQLAARPAGVKEPAPSEEHREVDVSRCGDGSSESKGAPSPTLCGVTPGGCCLHGPREPLSGFEVPEGREVRCEVSQVPPCASLPPSLAAQPVRPAPSGLWWVLRSWGGRVPAASAKAVTVARQRPEVSSLWSCTV